MTDAGCHILHVDMDAFFAAVEQRDRPELRGVPVIVGSPPNQRGVVSTASYEARPFGVHSAMPSRTAYRLCPHAVFLPVRMERYAEVSEQVMELLRSFTPMVEQVSVDEAFLDVRGVLHAWPGPLALARRLKQRIREELKLTGSVGVAPNKFLAKLASDLEKPDGLTLVPADPEAVRAMLAPLPVTRIWGVGKVTAETLGRYGIRTIGQVQALSLQTLAGWLGPAFAHHLRRLAHGQDDRPVVADAWEEKSISNEETFPEDCSDAKIVRQTLIELAENVGRRLRRAGKLARVGQIKVRFGDFRTITRQRSFPKPVRSDRELLGCALDLLAREKIREPVRLIGFGVSDLSPADPAADRQLSLFTEPVAPETERDAALDRVVDELRERYGAAILKRGDWVH